MATASELTRRHYEYRERVASRTARLGRRLWRSVDTDDIAASWAEKTARLLEYLLGIQRDVASRADEYTSNVLDSFGSVIEPAGEVNPDAFIGVASDGRPIRSLLERPAVATKIALANGATLSRAMATGEATADIITRTQVQDAGRVADGVAIAARPTVGYYRMLNPPSCSRCVLLAGRHYRYNAGFLRHPRCDCIHVPVKGTEAAESEGLISDPREYFDSLSREEQDRTFTKSGAEAVRDGADISQVVNARRGMSTAGRTTEGTTRRGVAGRRLQGRQRLMPEEIYRVTSSRAEAIELLKVNGFIL